MPDRHKLVLTTYPTIISCLRNPIFGALAAHLPSQQERMSSQDIAFYHPVILVMYLFDCVTQGRYYVHFETRS